MTESYALVSRGHAVKPEWIDAYNHMNMARYVALFDDVTYDLLDRIDLGLEYTRRTQHGLFIVDARIRFLKELRLGTPLEVALHFVGADHIRLHMYLELKNVDTGAIAATQEQIGLHASLLTRSTVPFESRVAERLRALVGRESNSTKPLLLRPQGVYRDARAEI